MLWAIGALLITLYALVLCVKTKPLKRKWLWILFILVGFGQFVINWSTGEFQIAPLALQLFSASALASPYGPWIIAVSLPIGAALFIDRRRKLLARTELGS